MAQLPGKKIGTIDIQLKRNRGRGQGRGEVRKELRLDDAGIFHAYHEGVHFSSNTKAELAEKLRIAIERTIEIVWDRYLVIEYEAEAWPTIADTGRPHQSGSLTPLSLTDDREILAGDPTVSRWRSRHWRQVITQIGLKWDLIEVSRPYEVPEKPGKPIRAQRDILYDADREEDGTPAIWTEKYGDLKELENADLPVGAVLWTTDEPRVELLHGHEHLAEEGFALALFGGAPAELAQKLDAAVTAGSDRLLAAGTEPQLKQSPRKKRA